MSVSNQITVVAFQPVQLAQAWFLQKNQMLQNGFLIFVTQRWHKASVACKNQSFLNWLFHSSIIFGAKFEISGTKWVEKTPIYIFSTFGSKINKFERKKSEKNEKIPKV